MWMFTTLLALMTGLVVPNRFVGAVTRTSGTNSLRISISSVFAPAVGPLPKDTVGAAKTAYARSRLEYSTVVSISPSSAIQPHNPITIQLRYTARIAQAVQLVVRRLNGEQTSLETSDLSEAHRSLINKPSLS